MHARRHSGHELCYSQVTWPRPLESPNKWVESNESNTVKRPAKDLKYLSCNTRIGSGHLAATSARMGILRSKKEDWVFER